jgi:hypothetical protein
MNDFFQSSVKLQMSLIDSMAASSRVFSENYIHFLEQQSALFGQESVFRRVAEAGSDEVVNPVAKKKKTRNLKVAKVDSPCCGPDLADHYGKRARDVDVERI